MDAPFQHAGFGFAALSALVLLPLTVAGAAGLGPGPDGPVAAVFPPWQSAGTSFAAASSVGAVVRHGVWDFVVVVQAPDRGALRAAGAWLLLDPLAAGCIGLARSS